MLPTFLIVKVSVSPTPSLCECPATRETVLSTIRSMGLRDTFAVEAWLDGNERICRLFSALGVPVGLVVRL